MKLLPGCCVFMILFFGFTDCTWSQTEVMRGTVIIVGRTKDQVVVATDSRATLKNGHSDDYCKISAFGNKLVFVSAGIRSFDLPGKFPMSWDSNKEARTASRDQIKNVEGIASDWGASSANILQLPASANPARFMRQLNTHGKIITIGVFAGVDPNGDIETNYAKIIIDPAAQDPNRVVTYNLQSVELGPLPLRWTVIGEAAIASEFLADKSARARSAWARWTPVLEKSAPRDQLALDAAQLVKWTIQYGPPNVGGPVDEIMIDNTGSHWILRKDSCSARE
jgi:hypothetical protein